VSTGDGSPPTTDPVGSEYPAHWEADVVLRDGSTAHLRPITPTDSDALQRFHVQQSAESIYFRFFAAMPRLSVKDLHRFTHVDHVSRVAFICLIGEEIVGVGRYDRVDPVSAEVAFHISDHHQGRGLGSVLLEHLAVAARENGVHTFVAEVLPQNRRMIGVFRDAGYEVRHAYDDGVISLSFAIDPTEKSLAVMEAREHRAEARSVGALVNPSSVVVIGASRREGTVGHRLLKDLLSAEFSGRLEIVHPHADRVLGVRAHRRLADVSGPIDVAVIAVPSSAVLSVVRDCAHAGVRGLVVLSGGFAETGRAGLEQQHELVRLARSHGMRVIGPASWGVINADPAVRLNVSLAETLPRPGRLGLFCQSGGLSVSVLDTAARRNLGVSTFLSAGNRADVSGNDCMQYWEEDEATDAVGLYLESIGNPRKFSRIARRLSRRKPVIVVKSGMSGFGVPPGHAVRSTRAPRRALDEMLRQSGCIRAENVNELFDIAQLVLQQPLPVGNRVAVVGNSDALGTLIADACSARDLQVVHGPVSLPPDAGAQEFRSALQDAFADGKVNSVVATFVPPMATRATQVAKALVDVARNSRIPVVACFLGMGGLHKELSADVRVIPTYPTPEEAVRALSAATRYGMWRQRDSGTRVAPDGCDRAATEEYVTELLREDPDGFVLSQEQATRLLAGYGVDVWPQIPVGDHREAAAVAAETGYPVVLKTTAPHLRHRVDLGGVRLGIESEAELLEDFSRMKEQLTPLGGRELVVQRMAGSGVACVLSTVEDPLFGPVVSFGLAGDATDLLDDVAHRIPPLTDVDVSDLIRSVRAAPKLFGHRGANPVDVFALKDLIARISCLADDRPEIEELIMNPVVVTEEGLAVLGASVRLRSPQGRTDAGRRGLTPSVDVPG
jgi:acyl-CoA synthetase (NDP forming)/RimJ/RimL family protein N-acetyltransferase